MLYQATVDDLEERLRSVSEDMARRGLVLATLMRLKQICNHASHGIGGGVWDEKDSGKFARLTEIAETIASRQEKLLVFTQFKEIVEPLSELLAAAFGRAGLVLHGGIAVSKRKDLVKAFQEDERIPFFVLSLKAGGSGLNLTAASHVVHFDRWWNPAVENQATDRAFRIGQKRNVLVHKFVCRGTIEERIDILIESKRQLAQDVLTGGGEINLTELERPGHHGAGETGSRRRDERRMTHGVLWLPSLRPGGATPPSRAERGRKAQEKGRATSPVDDRGAQDR